MTPDLRTRLVAWCDAKEATAKAATPGPWKLWGVTVMADQDGTSNYDTAVDVAHTVYRDEHGKPRTFDAAHIAANDPADVLAVVGVVRAVLALHDEVETRAEPVCAVCVEDDGDWDDGPYREVYPCPTLAALAPLLGDTDGDDT